MSTTEKTPDERYPESLYEKSGAFWAARMENMLGEAAELLAAATNAGFTADTLRLMATEWARRAREEAGLPTEAAMLDRAGRHDKGLSVSLGPHVGSGNT
jgi:hypothetical protein